MTDILQKLLVVTLSAILVVWVGSIAVGSSKLGSTLEEALSDPNGCSFSPDNFGCELNRPFDQNNEEQQEAFLEVEQSEDE